MYTANSTNIYRRVVSPDSGLWFGPTQTLSFSWIVLVWASNKTKIKIFSFRNNIKEVAFSHCSWLCWPQQLFYSTPIQSYLLYALILFLLFLVLNHLMIMNAFIIRLFKEEFISWGKRLHSLLCPQHCIIGTKILFE